MTEYHFFHNVKTDEDAKELLKQLIVVNHPDKANSEEERSQKEEITKRINQEFQLWLNNHNKPAPAKRQSGFSKAVKRGKEAWSKMNQEDRNSIIDSGTNALNIFLKNLNKK